jgi:hypothetical protein
MGAVSGVRTGSPELRERRVGAPAIARHEDDARAKRGQLRGRDLPDARRGAGDDDDLAVNGSLLRFALLNAATFYTIGMAVPGPTDCRAFTGLVERRPVGRVSEV